MGLTRGHVARQSRPMGIPESLRHERGERPADHLVGREAEHPLGARVEVGDVAVPVGREDGVVGGRGKNAEPLFTGPQDLLIVTPLFHIVKDQHGPQDLALLVAPPWPTLLGSHLADMERYSDLIRDTPSLRTHEREQLNELTAAVADAIEAKRLDLAPGRPLLVVESVDVMPDGKPIAISTARFAADRVELMVEY